MRTLIAIVFLGVAAANLHFHNPTLIQAALTDPFSFLADHEMTSFILFVATLTLTILSFLPKNSKPPTSTFKATSTAAKIVYPLKEIEMQDNDKDRFMCMFKHLKNEFLQHMRTNNMPDEAIQWADTMMEYNVPHGKLNRGITVLAVMRTLKAARCEARAHSEAYAKRSTRAHVINPSCYSGLATPRRSSPRSRSLGRPFSAGASSGCRRFFWWRTTSWTTARRVAAARAGTSSLTLA